VYGSDVLVERVIGSSRSPFKVVHRKVIFQLPHVRFHLLWVRLALMVCQRLFGHQELVQFMRGIEISTVLLESRYQLCDAVRKEVKLTPGTNGGSSFFASSLSQLIEEYQL
jgi:hypothetical protein